MMLGRGLISGAPSAGVPDATGTVSIPLRGTLDRGTPGGHRVPVPFLPSLAISTAHRSWSGPAVVGRSETPMDVVVDHADVLHEGVHAGGADEAAPLGFQLLGERVGVRRRLGEVRDRPRCTL